MKMKRIGRKWAAAAMALAAGLMTARAVEPVLDNLPGAPGQSRAYWEAVRAEAAAKKAADKAAASAMSVNAQAGGDFFTGKPYDADLGGYVFKYRTYDPHLGRWTTPDPSGFPDGANGYLYSTSPTHEVDASGLESENIHQDFSITIPWVLDVAVGAWDGAFVWSFAEGSEVARIEPQDPSKGFSGFTGVPLSIPVGGVNLGLGYRTQAVYLNKSAFETSFDEFGNQWKRWVVDLEVKWSATFTLGVDVVTKPMGSAAKYQAGHWYE